MGLPNVNGALFQLTWLGVLCPCLDKDEDRKARQALRQLNVSGKRIIWYSRDAGNSSSNSAQKLWNVAAGATSVIGGLFGGKTKTTTVTAAAIGGGGLDSMNQEEGAVEATFTVRDNPETGKPELFVDPLPRPAGQTVGYKLQILLGRVNSINCDPNSGKITFYARAPKGSSGSSTRQQQQQQQPPKALLVLGLLKDINVPADVGDQEMFVHNMSVLVEWERQRRAAISAAAGHDDDADEIEEEEQGNFLTKKAQQAKHFAQRELELQQTKRDREQRKSKLVGETGGGLKYTAIALANRATENSLT
jgi:hypothetical protein